MHVAQLSDHPGDLLDDAWRRRTAAEKQALAAYEDALIRYRARVQTLRVKPDHARHDKPRRDQPRRARPGRPARPR